MSKNNFFDESREQSQVKAEIVAKYFWVWAKVILGAMKKGRDQGTPKRIAYIDLFAGPGRYKDGTTSTPLKVLEQALGDDAMCQSLVTIFNDADATNSQSLRKEIESLPGIERLKFKPQVYEHTVGEEIARMFEQMKLFPTLFFVDPWGYKGLSLRLVNSVLKDWGCDCIFFFNYTRINMGLNNEAVREHMDALFGEERAEVLRSLLQNMSPEEREPTVVEEIAKALQDLGGKFVLPFRFRNEKGSRTSHHLFFVTKDFKGYEIMKDIMAKGSTSSDQGVPSFEYVKATQQQSLLFELSRPLDDLKDLLLIEFEGQTLPMVEIYRRHNVGRRFVKRNYKEVLMKMEAEGLVNANPPAIGGKGIKSRKRGTLADSVEITFGPRRRQ